MKNTVKRILCAAITMFLIAASLSGCFVPATDPTDTKKIDNGTANAEGTNNGTGGTPSGETTVDAGKSASQVTISEQVLVDRDGIKITAKSLSSDSIFGDGLKVLVENDSTKDVNISCERLIINDYMISDMFSASVAAGKKANETVYFSGTDLNDSGIKTIEQIELAFNIFDSKSFQTVFKTDVSTIKTSAFSGQAFPKADEGKELVNRDGVRIVGKYIKNDALMGKEIILYIENNTDKDIVVNCDDISINGFMMTALYSQDVCVGKRAVDGITILTSDLEKNSITDIKNVELKFKVLSKASFKELFTTDAIAFSAS